MYGKSGKTHPYKAVCLVSRKEKCLKRLNYLLIATF